MKDLFENYIRTMVELTFDFTPTIITDFSKEGVVSITLDGSPVEKMEMMGNGAINFQSLKQLLRVFARRNNIVSYLYIKPTDYKINKE